MPQNVESRLNTYIVQHTCAPTNIMQHYFGHDLVYFLASRRHSLARKPLRKTPDSPLCLSQTSSTKLGCCLCRFRGSLLEELPVHNILARGVLTETDLLWCTRGADQVLAYIEIRISGGCFCEGCLGVPEFLSYGWREHVLPL